MNTRRATRAWTAGPCAIVLIGVLVFPCTRAAAQQWRLIPVEVDGVKDTVVADFVLGADGTPWVALAQPRQIVCYWDGGQWHKPAGELTTDSYSRQLHVSPTGRAYLSQLTPYSHGRALTPPKPNAGALYLLKDKQAQYVTEFYHDTRNRPCPVFFDSTGRIWNWGEMFLAKYEDGRWERVEANVGPHAQLIEDADGNVYCFGKAVSCWRDGRFTVNVEAPSFPWSQPMPKGYLWGTDKALFISGGQRGVVVVDLKTLTVSDILQGRPLTDSALRELLRNARGPDARETAWQSLPVLTRSSFYDAFRDTRGNLWLLTRSPSSPDFFFIKVCAADNSVEERLETASIDWGSSMDGRRKPALCAKDGAIYFGARRNGVYLYRDGVLTHVGWQQGLELNATDWVCEHPDGTIWFASRRMGVAVHDPRGVPGPALASPFQTSWEEYPLAARVLVRDFQGHLWCCLRDQSRKISRWDGRAWEHFELGLDTVFVRTLLVDDLQRLHILMVTNPAGHAWRLTDGRVDRFTNFQEMLVDSVRTGAHGFKCGSHPESLISLVVGDQEIWCRDTSGSRLLRYKAGQWDQIQIPPFRTSIFRHKDDQVLIDVGAGFRTLDRGQLVEFANEQTRNQEYLLGESGLQPFDLDVYRAHPKELFPACKTPRAIYVFDDLASFRRFKQEEVPPNRVTPSRHEEIPPGAVKLPQHMDRIWLAPDGFWLCPNTAHLLQRYYRGLLLSLDTEVTPVAGDVSGGNCDAYEDVHGDLWIRRYETLFHVKRPRLDTHITAPQTTECTSPTLRVGFSGTSDGPADEALSYAWRLDGGPWSQPTGQDYADLEFVQAGVHEFEVLSIGSMGNLDTTPALLKLNVVLPVPDARIVSAPSGVVTDLGVAITYEIVKPSADITVSFQWRLDGGPWHDTRETIVRPAPLADGEHLFEVRAIADRKYIQAQPASAAFTVKVDYEKAIASAVEDLHATDYGKREAAARRLVSLADKCVPYLKKELQSADEDVRWWIQAVLAEIEDR